MVPPRWREIVFLGLVGMAGVVVLGFLVRSWTGEMPVDIWFDRHHTPIADSLAWAIGWILKPNRAVVIAVLLIGGVAWWTGSLAAGIGSGLAVGLGWGSGYLVKVVVNRPRPDWALLSNHITKRSTEAGFPSAHATFIATVVAVLMLVGAGRGWGRRHLVVIGAIAGVVADVAVAAARVYAGLHYPTDVLAGLVYGTCAGAVMYVGLAAVAVRTPVAERIDRIAGPVLLGHRGHV